MCMFRLTWHTTYVRNAYFEMFVLRDADPDLGLKAVVISCLRFTIHNKYQQH